MRTEGTPTVLEYRRRLAVERAQDGYSTQDIADFLGVRPRSVRRWVAAFHQQGSPGLASRPVPGRPPKLSATQEKLVRRFLADSPTEHGFATQLWTAVDLAELLRREWGVTFHPGYLTAWLRRRDFTPQRPRRVAQEHNDEAIARWLAQDWPRIKKKRSGAARP